MLWIWDSRKIVYQIYETAGEIIDIICDVLALGKKTMRIAIYKDTLRNGRGADAATAALAEGLRERGYDVSLLTQDGMGFPGSSFRAARFDAREVANCDVIVSSGTNELLSLGDIAHGDCPPILQQFHTRPRHVFKWKHPIRNRRIVSALRRVAAIQVLRPDFVEEVRRFAPNASVAVIGNWSVGASGRTSDETETTRILCPGALNRDKNQELLIRAFGRVADDFPEWTIDICGNGSTAWQRRLRRLAARGLDSRINFNGYCDLSPFYARCAFVAFPSVDEGFPLSLIDAAAFGKTALTVRDWIGLAAVDAGVVSDPTVDAYADGLCRLMSDPASRRRLGANAREFCAKHYSREKLLDEWTGLLASFD